MPDRTYQTQSLSFDTNDTSPLVIATTNTNGPCLLERLFSTNNVSAVNSSTNISMSATKSTKTNLSNGVLMARPFDEFPIGITIIPSGPLDEHNIDKTTKSDQN
ncbi:unnamed protein product [Rotaria sordida]|uniref:Uncharacterized protein n=1 Tax=Rotaria sordida TaxID=392033 RepID=A0A818VQI6_9BILA|nr:unnamed protein product [Rotaria sordida]CAF1451009.1 unnamed protein product [Rotaria sordida]CAF1638992.1 unnamed protein product [Rotaria sordida]CAF3714454.1 unnamed protein product [Rotaria sordida]